MGIKKMCLLLALPPLLIISCSETKTEETTPKGNESAKESELLGDLATFNHEFDLKMATRPGNTLSPYEPGGITNASAKGWVVSGATEKQAAYTSLSVASHSPVLWTKACSR